MSNIKFSKPKGLTIGRSILMGTLSLTLIFFSSIFVFLNFYEPAPLPVLEDDYEFPVVGIPWEPEPDEDGNMPITEDAQSVNEVGDNNNDSSNNSTTKPPAETKDLFYNFLICGRDATGGNTDVIIVISFDVKNNQLSALQFPRDSYINNKNPLKKVNAVFAYSYAASIKSGKKRDEAISDGMKTLRSTVKQTLGIPIHYGIYVDLSGFRAIVDIVGGVEIDVPMRMLYEDPEQGLYINLQKGVQVLDGKKAEQFVRFRSGYADADLGRIRAQQQFMSALIKKCFKFSIPQITQMVEAAYKYVATDIPTKDLLYFGKELMKLEASNIRFNTLPGEGRYIGSGSYFTLYKKETMEIVNKYHNWYKEDLTSDKFDIIEYARTSYQPVNIDGMTIDSMN